MEWLNIFTSRCRRLSPASPGGNQGGPLARWEAGEFLPQMPESLSQLDLLLLHVAKKRRVQQDGIHSELVVPPTTP